MTREHAKLLLEDLENKKHYFARWHAVCDGCGGEISESAGFVFMGEKKKVCIACVAAMYDDLKEQE